MIGLQPYSTTRRASGITANDLRTEREALERVLPDTCVALLQNQTNRPYGSSALHNYLQAKRLYELY